MPPRSRRLPEEEAAATARSYAERASSQQPNATERAATTRDREARSAKLYWSGRAARPNAPPELDRHERAAHLEATSSGRDDLDAHIHATRAHLRWREGAVTIVDDAPSYATA